jgi:hypothetical protein
MTLSYSLLVLSLYDEALLANKSRSKSRDACYHSVLNILSDILLSKNIQIKIHRIIILPVVLYGPSH